MLLKYLFLVGLVSLFFFYKDRENGLKKYYFWTVVLFFVREMNMDPIGDIVPSAVMAIVLFMYVLYRNWTLLKGWRLYLCYLILILCIGGINAQEVSTAFFWSFTLFVVMILAALPQKIFTKEEDVTTLLQCLLGVSFIFSFTTLLGFMGFADDTIIYSSELKDETNYHASRVYGITSSNLVQCISAISIVLVPFAKFKKKWMELVFILITTFAALVTLKRMTMIALFVALAYYFEIQRRERQYKVMTILLLLCGCLIYFFADGIIYRLNYVSVGLEFVEDHAIQTRFYRIQVAQDAWNLSPFWGMGAGYLTYIHNGFWEMMANCGIFGTIIFLLGWLPKPIDVLKLNPWAVATFLFVVTCFMLEAVINRLQLMAFLGLFLGGYLASKKYHIKYVFDDKKKRPNSHNTHIQCGMLFEQFTLPFRKLGRRDYCVRFFQYRFYLGNSKEVSGEDNSTRIH